MKSKSEKVEYIPFIIIICLTLVLYLYNHSWSFGFILGIVFSKLHFAIIEFRINRIFENRSVGFLTNFTFIMGNISFIIPLGFAILYPEIFNIITVALGIVFFKYYIYIKEIFFWKSGK